jgi:ribosomal protein S18 acetylase RimI-like enzyme
MLRVKIREVALNDADDLAELYPKWGFELTRERIMRSLMSTRERRYVAEVKGKVVAHVFVKRGTGNHKHLAYLYSLIVHPDCRNKGIATKLLKYVLAHLPQDIEIALAQVQHDNKASLSVFKKLGFERYGCLKNAWKDGTEYKHNVLLKKELKKRKKR